MSRNTFIFGNGLGRALNNDYFQLSAGLAHVWNDRSSLTQAQKDLIISAIEGLSSSDYPSSEDELDKLQVAIVASGFLKSFESNNIEWLNDHSRNLPSAFNEFVHQVASYFHDSELELPSDFIKPLVDFIRRTSSHVGVLNYDNLLYDSFVREEVLRGYNDTLCDGFRKLGFDPEYMDRHRKAQQSWYLHLHGSPLYIGNRKLMGGERRQIGPAVNSHIVLTHVRHKPMVISSSKILMEYWRRLGIALDESNGVVAVGYSGEDKHLNELIDTRLDSKKLVVVERKGEENEDARKRFWQSNFKSFDIKMFLVNSILDFRDWDKAVVE